jgi:hypothetical protein
MEGIFIDLWDDDYYFIGYCRDYFPDGNASGKIFREKRKLILQGRHCPLPDPSDITP